MGTSLPIWCIDSGIGASVAAVQQTGLSDVSFAPPGKEISHTSGNILLHFFHHKACNVNRIFWFWASIVHSFHTREVLCRRARVHNRSSKASRRATFTGSSPVCVIRAKTKANGTN